MKQPSRGTYLRGASCCRREISSVQQISDCHESQYMVSVPSPGNPATMNKSICFGSRLAGIWPRSPLRGHCRVPVCCLQQRRSQEEQSSSRQSTITRAFDYQMSMEMMSNPVLPELAEGLEAPVQLVYLIFLLGLLSAAAYTIVNQVLTRREMDERSKVLGELIRTGDAVSEDYFELGVVLARKRLFTQALKNYTKAVKLWDGEEVELAQVHNAMGYCYLNMDRKEDALREFQTSTRLQPGYVTAWNNLADALEKEGRWKDALTAYESAYELEPENDIAKAAVDRLRTKTRRITTLM